MKKSALRRLIAQFRTEWPRLAIVTVFVMVSVGCSLTGPWLLGNATNILFDGIIKKNLRPGLGAGVDFTRLGQVLGLAALAYLLAAAFSWAQAYIMAGIAQRTVFRLREAVAEKLARLPLRYLDGHAHGDILSRVTNDLDNLTTGLQAGLSQVLTSVLTVLGAMSVMLWISPPLAAVSLISIPLVTVVTALIARRSKPHFIAQWNGMGQLNGLIEETHTGHNLVVAFGQQRTLIEEFDRQNEHLYKVNFRAQWLSGVIQPTIAFLGNLNYVFIAALGGYWVTTGMISLGGVQAFIQYSRQISAPITQIASQANMLQSALASAKRVFDLLDAPEEPATAPTELKAAPVARPLAAGRIQLQHVSFGYQPDRPVIEGFTLEVAPGQTVAIVGPTGAGKTTIVNLLMRFYEIDGGRILLDGTDYKDLSREEVRCCFGMVLQDTWLFAGTIRENIGYGREDATDEEIVAAAEAAHADHFVRTLPDGYSTVLDAEASMISAGQKQLLTIARAFLASPSILILDEATSNVDTRTEILIQNAMARLRVGRTSFVIAHRLSTIRDADVIVVMEAGRIVEQGSHNDLLNYGRLYRDLYDSQFADVFAQ